MADGTDNGYTPAQQRLVDVWEEHMRCEFAAKSVEDTMVTMVEDVDKPYVNHVPTLTGGVGRKSISEFYGKYFIPQMPEDTETVPIARTVGNDKIVDEMIFKFTHTCEMAWMLPNIAPTGKRVEVPLVAVIGFIGDKVSFERIYWDQASVLLQLGLLENAAALPVAGIESAQKVSDPASVLSNGLIERK